MAIVFLEICSVKSLNPKRKSSLNRRREKKENQGYHQPMHTMPPGYTARNILSFFFFLLLLLFNLFLCQSVSLHLIFFHVSTSV